MQPYLFNADIHSIFILLICKHSAGPLKEMSLSDNSENNIFLTRNQEYCYHIMVMSSSHWVAQITVYVTYLFNLWTNCRYLDNWPLSDIGLDSRSWRSTGLQVCIGQWNFEERFVVLVSLFKKFCIHCNIIFCPSVFSSRISNVLALDFRLYTSLRIH